MENKLSVWSLFPRILGEGGALSFGGNQNWYSRYTSLYSGCGPVAAANVVAVLARGQGLAARLGLGAGKTPIPRAKFEALMDESYEIMGSLELPFLPAALDSRFEKAGGNREQMGPLAKLPPSLGNTLRPFVRGTLALAREYGLRPQPHVLYTHFAGEQRALRFIRQGLGAGSPVVLLTRFNRHPLTLYPEGPKGAAVESRITSPHFMTIARLAKKPGGYDVWLSTWGMPARVDLGALARSWRPPLALGSALLYFSAAPPL